MLARNFAREEQRGTEKDTNNRSYIIYQQEILPRGSSMAWRKVGKSLTTAAAIIVGRISFHQRVALVCQQQE
jgi:hypothetical protein